MSFSSGFSEVMNTAVNNAVAADVVVTVAAGNDKSDAVARSPASAENGTCTSTHFWVRFVHQPCTVHGCAPLAALLTPTMTNPKDLRRLGYAGRGDVVLGEGHRWRQREQRRKHSATSSLTNHMVPQYNSQKDSYTGT